MRQLLHRRGLRCRLSGICSSGANIETIASEFDYSDERNSRRFLKNATGLSPQQLRQYPAPVAETDHARLKLRDLTSSLSFQRRRVSEGAVLGRGSRQSYAPFPAPMRGAEPDLNHLRSASHTVDQAHTSRKRRSAWRTPASERTRQVIHSPASLHELARPPRPRCPAGTAARRPAQRASWHHTHGHCRRRVRTQAAAWL